MRRDTESNIHVYIERLILDGLPTDRIHAPHIQVAVEAELKRLLVENGLAPSLQSGMAVPNVHANAIQISRDSKPTQMGTQIARSIYSGIGDKR